MKKKHNKPKYAMGADIAGSAANIAAPIINKYTTKTVKDAYGQQYETQDVWGGIGEGAAKGAAISAMLGGADFGASAVIGGAIGGITTKLENDETKKKIAEANKKFTALNVDNAKSNFDLVEAQGFKSEGQQYATMFKKGGVIPKYKKYPEGGELYNTKRAEELGYKPDATGHLPSVDSETGMWLKSKAHPTAWKELMEYSLNPELQKSLEHPVVNIDGYFGTNQLQYKPKYKNRAVINNPEYEVEGNEVVQGQAKLEGENQLSSDMVKAVGPSHEEGGVMGKGGDRVFSDRLKPSKDFTETLKTFKVNIPATSTYAQVAEKLGKMKGKYEDNVKSPNPVTHRTAKVMLDRVDSFIEATFQEQEISKQDNEMKTKYAKGGKLPKYADGIKLKDRVQFNPPVEPDFDINQIPEELLTGNTKGKTTPFNQLPIGINRPNTKLDIGEFGANKYTAPENLTMDNIGKATFSKEVFSKPNINSDYANIGQGINLGTYLSNLNTINKQQTNINRITAKPNLVKAPKFLNLAKYNISKEANALNKDITNKSGNIQDTFARRASINANAMDKINETTQSQANVDLDVNNRNTGIMNDYKNRKAENENADMIDRLQGENAKKRLKQDANNSFLAGVMGNVASNRAYKTDEAKMILESMKDGNRGVDDRTLNAIKTQHPDLYDRYFKHLEKKKYGGKLKPKYC